MNRTIHRTPCRAARSPLYAALLTALGLAAGTLSSASAAPHAYTADETITDERTHAQGFDVGIDKAVVLDITGNGHLITNGRVNLGAEKGGNGTLRLDGPGARFTDNNFQSTDVGAAGEGTLIVQGGAQATSRTLRVGVNTGSSGRVHVTGAGSKVKARYLHVSHEGDALLRIDGGAVVEVEADLLSENRTPLTGSHRRSGRIEISGAGSQLKAHNARLGGQLLIADGAELHTGRGGIHTSRNGPGAAVITGAGSRWVNDGKLEVDTGLDIRDGGKLQTDTLVVSGARTIHDAATDLPREQLRVTGAGSLLKATNGIRIGEKINDPGTLTLSEGGRAEAGGTLRVGPNSYLVFGGGIGGTTTAPTWQAPVAAGELDDSVITLHPFADGVVFNHSGNMTLANTLRNDGEGHQRNGGALISQAGTTTLTGDLTRFGGRVQVNGGTLVLDTDTYTDATGYSFQGDAKPRQYMFAEAGTLVLNGEHGFRYEAKPGDAASSFRTAWATVTGTGVLAGNGTVGNTWVYNGGTLSPGHDGVGTFTVDGDLFVNAGGVGPEHVASKAFLDVDLRGDGAADQVRVTGSAYIGKGATTEGLQGETGVRVTALDPDTSYQRGQRYTLLQADGGVSGGFDDVVSNSAFVTGALVQDGTTVQLEIGLDAADADDTSETLPPIVFARAARTANQRAVAAALDSLHQSGGALALYNQLLMQNEDDARRAFDELSGEVHASTRAMLLRDDALRAGVLGHLRGDPADEGNGSRAWVAGLGDARSQRGDGSAASRLDHSEGLLVGYDLTFGERWTVGAVGGSQSLRQTVRDRGARSEVDALQGGMYLGFRHDALWLRGGISYADYQVDTERSLGAGTPWEQTLRARYKAHAVSTFSEAGVDLALPSLILTPYLGLAHTVLSTQEAAETNGSAALWVMPGREQVWTATAGVRAAWDIGAGQRNGARVEGGLAWQNASGGRRVGTTQIFASGSESFTVHGAPLARNVGIAELGVSLKPTGNSRLSLHAQGQVGDGQRAFGAQLNWNVAF